MASLGQNADHSGAKRIDVGRYYRGYGFTVRLNLRDYTLASILHC